MTPSDFFRAARQRRPSVRLLGRAELPLRRRNKRPGPIRWTSVFALCALLSVGAQEQKPFYLPKNPVAAAYVLGRLSNKELTEAPRSEFVYIALLQRKGLDRKYRIEALEGLAKLRQTDRITEIIRALGELDKKGEESEPVLRDLSAILLQSKAEELSPKRASLLPLARQSQTALGREIAFAGIVLADGNPEKIWTETPAEQLPDLILSADLLRPAVRASFDAKVRALAQKADSPEVQRAAIRVLGGMPGKEAETFSQLAGLLKLGTHKNDAIAGLERLPRKSWPKEQAEPLLEPLLEELKKVPAAERGEESFSAASQFAMDLASLLPPEKAAPIQKVLRGLGGSVFLVRTIYEQMLYDKQLLVAEADKPIQIVLQNDDAMPHNLVVTSPGALEEIGVAAEKMTPEPDAQGRAYIPSNPKVLYATKLVDPGQRDKLSFTAPAEPGDYPYVCTFPGHWRRMVGNLRVVRDLEAYLANQPAAPEARVTEWKVEDFSADLAKPLTGRNPAAGKELFTMLACAQCHKLGAEGTAYGPDLTDVLQRYKNDQLALLRQILEPSAVVEDRYRNYQFELKNGESVLGMILKEEPGAVTIQAGPSDALIQKIPKDQIKEKTQQPSSVMPAGLLNLLSKEQVLDLLAFVESGGKVPPPHQH